MGCWCCGMAVCDCLGGCTDRTSDRDDLILLIRFYRKTDGFDCFQSSPSVFFSSSTERLLSDQYCPPWEPLDICLSWASIIFFIIISEQLSLNFQFDGRSSDFLAENYITIFDMTISLWVSLQYRNPEKTIEILRNCYSFLKRDRKETKRDQKRQVVSFVSFGSIAIPQNNAICNEFWLRYCERSEQ